MYNTGNPVPSSALEDMADNAQTFDALVTKTDGTTTDRKGVNRRVFQQIIMDMGFQPLSGSFQTGATITARNQCLHDTSTGTFYSWSGVIPEGGYVVPAGSTPATAGGVGALLWVDRTDIILQANLAATTGAGLIGTSWGITVQDKLDDIESSFYNVGTATGTNVIAVNYTPVVTSLKSGAKYKFTASEANTGAVTLNINGIGAKSVYGLANLPLQGGEISGLTEVEYNSVNDRFILLSSVGGKTQVPTGTQSSHAVNKSQLDANSYSPLYVNVSVLNNALTFKLPAGSNLIFRNPKLSTGTPVKVTTSADLTYTIPQGATQGTLSGILANLIPVVFYNGGSPVLGAVNASGGVDLSDGQLFSATAVSTSATSASVIYASSAVLNSPAIFLPPVQITEAAAGTWATAPSLVQPVTNQNTAMFEKRMFIPSLATTSGAAIDQAIPSWARRITILFNGVSTSGTSLMLLRLGAPTIVATGYSSVAFNSTGQSVSNASNTTGFLLMYALNGITSLRGSAVLVSPDGVSWIESSTMSDTANATSLNSSGGVTLPNLATVLRLTTVNGTDTFDAGSISLLIEG